jgi:pimeloyl-ACP methyl ester carboxylesterase
MTDSLSEKLFFYKKTFFKDADSKIRSLAQLPSDKALSMSITTLKYLLSSLEESVDKFNRRQDILRLKNQFDNFQALVDKCSQFKNLFTQPGYMLAAFKCSSDSSLQPFSIFLPKDFDPAKSCDLMLVLHGSGVDEVGNINFATRTFESKNYILIAPRGRDLSAWYSGQTETDVVDLLVQIKNVFNVKNTLAYGFSMGGYGVWKFCLKYPQLFNAGIVISGIPFNLRDNIPENDMNNFVNNSYKVPFLVVHGTDDHSLDISYTNSFVQKLQKLNYNIDYFSVEGGGHGNFSSTKYVLDWLAKMNF